MSVIGFSQVGKRVDEKIEAVKKEIIEAVTREAEKTGQPLPVNAMEKIVAEELDLTRMIVQRDVKGIL